MELFWVALALISVVIAFVVGHEHGVWNERRRCTRIVEDISAAEECCGQNYDSENDNVVGPCCGRYFRQCDGATALRLMRGNHQEP